MKKAWLTAVIIALIGIQNLNAQCEKLKSGEVKTALEIFNSQNGKLAITFYKLVKHPEKVRCEGSFFFPKGKSREDVPFSAFDKGIIKLHFKDQSVVTLAAKSPTIHDSHYHYKFVFKKAKKQMSSKLNMNKLAQKLDHVTHQYFVNNQLTKVVLDKKILKKKMKCLSKN